MQGVASLAAFDILSSAHTHQAHGQYKNVSYVDELCACLGKESLSVLSNMTCQAGWAQAPSGYVTVACGALAACGVVGALRLS